MSAARGSPRPVLVVATCLLCVALAAPVSALGRPAADPWPPLLLATGSAAVLYLGWALPRRLAPLYGLLTAGAVAALILTAPDGLSGAPLAGPLGYGNANGALCAQATAAAMVPVMAARKALIRGISLLLALSLVVIAWATASAAGFGASLLCLLMPLSVAATPAARRSRAAPLVVLAAASLATVVLMLTALLGTTYDRARADPGALERLVDRTLSERRVVLWSDAIDLIRADPLTGVGAGRFQDESRTARSDDDARWAHSGLLQYGAETGLLGLLSLLGVSAGIFMALWQIRGALAAVGACAAAALTGHAGIDYVLHFPAVPLLTVATVGVCLGHSRLRRSQLT